MRRSRFLNRSRTKRRLAGARRGLLALEVVLFLPLVLLVVLAVVEFALLLLAAQAVSAAASVGAREASLPSATTASVERRVARALHGWKFAADVEPVRISPADPQTVPTGQNIAVTVAVNAADAAPNLLSYIGLSLAGQKVETTYVYRKE
jgi:Flp pilus assembly protein TadG